MHDRILDISDDGARLSVRLDQLIVSRNEAGEATIPLADLAVLILAHPQISITQPALAGVMAHGGAVIVCDQVRLPSGLLLPLQSHSVQTERMLAQARAPLPVQKRLWQQLVRAKIAAQATLLQKFRGQDNGLWELARRVRSGDPQNLEAQAARRYWSTLFGGNTFRRDPDAQDQNRLLNYGYAVLRAIVGRALCASGLHPSLGVHHHNRYNAFCLADDVMEPFRPVVDQVVAAHVEEHGSEADLGRDVKRRLLTALTGRCLCGGMQRTLFDAVSRTSASMAGVFLGTAARLELPDEVVHASAL